MKKNKWKYVLAAALIVAGLFSLLASTFPDGLNKIAKTQGFMEKATQMVSGVMPQYKVPGIQVAGLAKSLAGIIGTFAVFALLFFVGKYLYKIEE